MQVSPTVTAVVVLLAVLAIYYLVMWLGRKKKEKFASKEAHEVAQTSKKLFDGAAGKVSFSEYKAAIPTADAVIHADTRTLWKSGQLTPEKVQEIL